MTEMTEMAEMTEMTEMTEKFLSANNLSTSRTAEQHARGQKCFNISIYARWVENYRKYLIQHVERSELRLYFK